MFLREYLYVDIDKVRGILSQIEEGVPDSTTVVGRKEKAASHRNTLVGELGGKSIGEESLEKSLGDALFKILEEELEPQGVLRDISEELTTIEGARRIHASLRPGSVVRITAPGRLFHPEQLSHAMVGIATAATGIAQMYPNLDHSTTTQPQYQPGKGGGPHRGQGGKGPPKLPTQLPGAPEDTLLFVPEMVPFLGLSRDFMTGMVRFVRGIFSEGIHLQLSPLGEDGPVITARLESGRRFLDSTPEVIFSRYGFKHQEWTLVGTVGHVGELPESKKEINPNTSFTRAGIVEVIGTFLQVAGNSALIDLPTGLGFSVVPLAVYRAIGWGTDGPPGSEDTTPVPLNPPTKR
jgi:hypothetical protein